MNQGLLSAPMRIFHFPTNPDLRCISRWCERHSRTRLFITVGPPLAQCLMWCASVQAGTHVQPGKAQPLSRAINATRCSALTNLFPGFASKGAAVIVEQHGRQETITSEKPGLRHREWPEPGHVPDIEIRQRLFTISSGGCCGAVSMLSEIMGVDVHVHVWTLPTIGAGLGAVQIAADQFGEPVRGPFRRRPRIRGSVRCWGGHRQIRQRRQQHFTGEGIEITTHHHPTIQRRRDPQLIEIHILGRRNLIRFEQPLQRRDHVPHLRRRRLHPRRSRQQ